MSVCFTLIGKASEPVAAHQIDHADPYNQTAPNFMPAAGGPTTQSAVAAPMTGFFEPAEYVGALPPGGTDWTQGWTSYPAR